MARVSAGSSLGVLIRAIRIADPHSMVAIDREGAETPIAMTGSRGKWERGARTLISLGAVQARMLDADGAVTEVISCGEADASEPGTAPARSVSSEVASLLKLVLEAQDKAIQRHTEQKREEISAMHEMMREVTTAAISVMKTTADRAERLETLLMKTTAKRERDLGEALRSVEQLAADNAEAAPDENPADAMMGELLNLAVGKPRKKAEGA